MEVIDGSEFEDSFLLVFSCPSSINAVNEITEPHISSFEQQINATKGIFGS